MENEFPKLSSSYLKASDFQNNETVLTFIGWDKKSNEDDSEKKKGNRTWKDKLDFILPYSYPKHRFDKAGEPIIDEETGEPMINKYYDDRYPHGYSILYMFEEGQLESGSKPLFQSFCRVRPKAGDKVYLLREGEGLSTTWTLKKFKDMPVINVDKKPDELDSIDLREPGQEG